VIHRDVRQHPDAADVVRKDIMREETARQGSLEGSAGVAGYAREVGDLEWVLMWPFVV
jgi:hypothetical protein